MARKMMSGMVAVVAGALLLAGCGAGGEDDSHLESSPSAESSEAQTEDVAETAGSEDPRCDTRGDNHVTDAAEAYATPMVTTPGLKGTGPGKESDISEFEAADYSDTQYLVGWGVGDYAGGSTEAPDKLENAYVIVQDSNYDCSIIEMTGGKSDATMTDGVIYAYLLEHPLPDDARAAWVRFDNPEYEGEDEAVKEEEAMQCDNCESTADPIDGTVITELWNVDGGAIDSSAVDLLKDSGELP